MAEKELLANQIDDHVVSELIKLTNLKMVTFAVNLSSSLIHSKKSIDELLIKARAMATRCF